MYNEETVIIMLRKHDHSFTESVMFRYTPEFHFIFWVNTTANIDIGLHDKENYILYL